MSARAEAATADKSANLQTSSPAKHTPGPWLVKGGNGNLVYSAQGWIADVRAGTKGSHGSEVNANARLIAAAPELLDVLRVAFNTLQGECGRPFRDLSPTTWRRIEAAIDQATGTP